MGNKEGDLQSPRVKDCGHCNHFVPALSFRLFCCRLPVLSPHLHCKLHNKRFCRSTGAAESFSSFSIFLCSALCCICGVVAMEALGPGKRIEMACGRHTKVFRKPILQKKMSFPLGKSLSLTPGSVKSI